MPEAHNQIRAAKHLGDARELPKLMCSAGPVT